MAILAIKYQKKYYCCFHCNYI